MHRIACILFLSLILLCLNCVNCFYDDQPKLISNKGNLIIESAKDKNITIRLIGNGRFLANDVDLMSRANERNSGISLPAQNQWSNINSNTFNTEERILLSDLQRNVLQLNNNTYTYPLRFSRINQRIQNINRRISLLLTKLRTNKCDIIPCKNGGSCIPMYNDFKCHCPDNWQGVTCEVDVDECLLLNGSDLGCQNGAWCQNTLGGYSCQCKNGFTGIHCNQRTVDCLKSPPGELCGHGICVPAKTDFGYQCICEQGWTTNGVTPACTTDVDECELNKNRCHSTCINLPGSFHCGPCQQGYTGNGLVCRDINECENNNGGCSTSPQVNCINTEGSYHCGSCPPGWTGDGRYCSRSDSISCPIENPCYDRNRCQYISGEMVCSCPIGMQGNGYGANGCRFTGINPCTSNSNLCANGGTCIPTGNSYRCICRNGFDNNANCSLINPCNSNPCHNGGTCKPNGNTFTCTCPPDVWGRTCLHARTCNGVFTEYNGSLENINYSPNIRCAWLIKTNETKILNITFTKFDLEDSSDCTSDWLQIHDGRSSASPLIGRFCGNKLPQGGTIYSSHNQIYIWFRSNNSNKTNEGFHLDWQSIDPICGGIFKFDNENKNGVIKSPGYPGKSPPNRDCLWQFNGPYGKRFEFRFFMVSLGSTAQECDDYINILDSGEELEKICESGLPQPKKSISNVVSIDFHTDSIGFDSAFQLHYELVDGQLGCGGHFQNEEGYISSPTLDGQIIQNMICWYLIEQPIGTHIQLEFTDFELANFFNCSLHSLEIYDGQLDTDPLIGRYCSEVSPGRILSTSNFLLVKYKYVDNLMHSLYKGFIAKYNLNCDQKIYNETGYIQSPGYPNPYYSNINCLYTIIAPMHNLITLRFEMLKLTREDHCNLAVDNIEVYRRFYIPDRYCTQPPNVIISETSQLKIAFRSYQNTDNATGFRAFYRFDQVSCGGILDQPNGTLIYTDIIATSLLSKYCQWIIMAPNDTNSISLQFDYFDLGSNNNCSNNIQLFMNTTESDHKMGETACGKKPPLSVTYNTNILTIILNMATSLQATEGFSLSYHFLEIANNCGGNFSAGFGTFQSPNYPNEYPNDIDCVWILHAPLGHQIELIPIKFSLENTTSKCSEDYLEIRNGMTENSPIIGKYCGEEIPQRIPSFTNHLHITFHTDWSITHSGFLIDYEQTTTGCGGTLTSYEGSIHSPHYPDIVNGAAQCDWYITTSAGSKIQFNITNFNNNDVICSTNGQLLIYDGPNSWHKKIPLNCNDTKIMATSKTNQLFIRYISYKNENNMKFLFEYQTNCQLILDDLNGIIESPNFPYNYPNDLLCDWHIKSKKNEKIHIILSHLELEGDNQLCPYDILKIYDLENNVQLNERKLCKDRPQLLISRGNEFHINFETDFSNGAKGFRLEYQIDGCGEYFTENSGYLETPNSPYSLNVYCMWQIETDFGNIIQLNIMDFYIDPDHRDCSTNYLTISNEKDDQHPIITSCGETKTKLIPSTGKMMFVHFETDSYHSKKYFKASYTVKKSTCGGVINADDTNLTSPNYPEDYPINLDCEWKIIGEHQHRYQLAFVTFDIEQSDNCNNDFVEIYDGDKKTNESLLLRHCGGNLPITNLFQSTSNKVLLIFHTNNQTNQPGWKLNILKNCGTNLNTVPPGVLRKHLTDNNCQWTLKSTTEGAHITVTFLQVLCTCTGFDDRNCDQENGISIYEGDSNKSPLKISFCTHHPPPITSNGQTLTIVANSGTFDAYYSESLRSCGGTMKSLRGQFATPLYPNAYPANIECIWQIDSMDGNFIEIQFQTLDIVMSDECNDDYVEIRQNNATGPILALLCGKEKPLNSIQIYQNVWIKFRSTSQSVSTGFLASYNYVHDNDLISTITQNSGNIRPPPIHSIKGEINSYTWRIQVPTENVILLNFREYSQGLKFFDGFDENAAVIEIKHSPSLITSASNVVYLVSENQILHDFHIEWHSMSTKSLKDNDTSSGCHEILLIDIDAKTNLSSKNYPNSYANNIDCDYIIKPEDPSTHVYLELYEANLEDFPDCDADSLIISSSRNLIDWQQQQKLCNIKFSDKAHLIVNGTPYLKLQFHTDGSVNGIGFTTLIKTDCGSYLTEPTGLISVDMIMNSTLSSDCVWQIELPLGKRIEFEYLFEDNNNYDATSDNNMDPNNIQCTDSYTLLRDGYNDDSPIIQPGRICNELQINQSIPILTSTNRAYVKFHFTHIKKITWKLQYREHIICGSEIHLTKYLNSTNITSPNYPNIPHPFSECIWTFIAPAGQTLQIEFINRFNFIYGTTNCNNEYIELRDGSTNLARRIGKFCRKPSQIQRTTNNVLYMKFVANLTEPMTGFQAIISISQCGQTVGTQFIDYINSENYPIPGSYRFNTICIYTIKVAPFYRLNLTLIDIHLPYNVNNLNESDHIEIYSITSNNNNDENSLQSNELITTLYGNNTMKNLAIDSSHIQLKFYTYKSNSMYRGFKIRYDKNIGRCYKNVENEMGELQMPRQITKSNFISCRWKITVPKGRIVQIQIVDIDIAPSSDDTSTTTGNYNQRITFYNDFNMNSLITSISNINNITEYIYNSTDNNMLIRIYGGFRSTLRNLKILYTSYELSACPNNILNNTGQISISNSLLSKNFYCSSEITLNGHETLGFHIQKLLFTSRNLLISTPVIRFKVRKYWNFIEFKENTTNTNIGLPIQTANLIIQQTELTRIFDLSITYKKHNCGGLKQSESDFPINSTTMNLTNNYGRLDCAWQILIDGNIEYNLTINLNLTSQDCNQEYLIIYGGQYPNDIIVKKLCNNIVNYNYTIKNRMIYLHYHNDNYQKESKFDINVIPLKKCGGLLTSTYNEQKLQFKQTDYRNNLECIWDFKARNGFSTALEFYDRYFIESSTNCTKDSLIIKTQYNTNRNNNNHDEWYEYPKLCGRNLPEIINTTNQNVQLIFRSDDQITGDGFNIKFKQYCGGIYNVTNQRQTIQSPENWSNYGFMIRCNYTLMTTTNNFINIKFKKFDISTMNFDNDNCKNNKLKVYLPNENNNEDTVEIGTYCKKDAITEFRSRHFIIIYLETRYESNNIEFDYYLETCGGDVNSPMSIHSPFGDTDSIYPHGMECIWKILAPTDKEIIIKFKYIDMERGYDCKYDYIGIYNAYEETKENRIALICGNLTEKSPHIKISNNIAMLVTRSDDYISGKGFSAEIGFTKKCDKHIHYGTTNFTYTHYELDYYTPNAGGYDTYLDCHILFTVDEGYQIEIEFEDFNVIPCNVNDIDNSTVKSASTDSECNCDYLEIFDSYTSTMHTKSIGKYCGNNLPGIFQTSQQSLLLRFVTDGRNNGRGFKAAIKHKTSLCGTEVIHFQTDREQVIHSPNFGVTAYPANVYCKWIISSNDSFQIHFNQFQLQDRSENTGNCNDYVQLLYPDFIQKGNHIFCGNNTPNDVTFSFRSYMRSKDISSIEIIFRSDSAIEKSGFSLTIRAATVCNTTFTQLSGSTHQLKIPENCDFYFVVPEHYTLSFFIPSIFDFNYSENCSQSLKFYETDTNKLLQTVCSDRLFTSKQIFLKTNKAYISTSVKNGSIFYLDMFYIANDNGVGCGGKTTELKGSFTSPYYPENYRNYTSCRWDIDVSSNNVISIRFNDFNMGNKINCQSDYLQIIDISLTGVEKVSRQYCGNDDPAFFTSQGSKVAVVYKRTMNFDGKGWSLAYASREVELDQGDIILHNN